MLIFNEEGWERMPADCVKDYKVRVSRAFVEKHGTAKIQEVGRKAIINCRNDAVTAKSFLDAWHRLGTSCDISVGQKLCAVAASRGITMHALIRTSLHCHLLNGVKPVKTKREIKRSVCMYLSPFEKKLLDKWVDKNKCPYSDYLSTFAAVLEPQKEPDLVNLRPRKQAILYPTPTLLENFLHTVNVYGFDGSMFLRQIWAFLDRPFNPKRVEDRYLDWLTQGYASTLKAS